MFDKPKAIILQVLEIIEFRENKERFADQFINLCLGETYARLLKLQSEDVLSQIRDVFQQSDMQKNVSLFMKYFQPEQFNQTLQQITKEFFEDYIKTVTPTLTPARQNQLLSYLSTLDKQAD